MGDDLRDNLPEIPGDKEDVVALTDKHLRQIGIDPRQVHRVQQRYTQALTRYQKECSKGMSCGDLRRKIADTRSALIRVSQKFAQSHPRYGLVSGDKNLIKIGAGESKNSRIGTLTMGRIRQVLPFTPRGTLERIKSVYLEPYHLCVAATHGCTTDGCDEALVKFVQKQLMVTRAALFRALNYEINKHCGGYQPTNPKRSSAKR